MRQPSSEVGAVFGVYDCTGHGVPGAFMTLLAERALDAGVEASSSEGNSQDRAGVILAYVDGMDAFLLDYRPGETSFYASANFRVFAQVDDEFTELESDEASIGYRMEPGEDQAVFKTRALDLSVTKSLVIVSDGILDQKGGAKGLSLGRRRLLRLLQEAMVNNNSLPRLDGARLMAAIKDYQGDEEQRDDMTLIVLSLPKEIQDI